MNYAQTRKHQFIKRDVLRSLFVQAFSTKHSASSIQLYNTTVLCLKMSRALKREDERELSRLYEAEFNQSDLHDRVLIFDVVASWPRRHSEVNAEENEKNEASDQSEDANDGEAAEIENEETGMNGNRDTGMNPANDENESGSQDCEIASKYANRRNSMNN